MIEWQCDECGKKLYLEDKFYKSYYKGKENCLECNNEKFIADAEQTAEGKWRLDCDIMKNKSGEQNDVVDFHCNKCNETIIAERTMYNAIYSGQNMCWSCRKKI